MPEPMLLMSIIAVANMRPARRPKTTPGTVTAPSPAVAAGSTRSAIPATATATATRSMPWRRVCNTHGASSATNTGAMYSSATPTVTLEARMETK